ncbi:tautomerase family protein [Croceicoccus gelatinilyticus]|uniref:tautomerase family protein n=1 Tax=Croceicoccus gelatinilyticus TaxID=2835536 RepID=UPI001BCFDB47|nr:tautomerase family protein [Croceicoccus gelatinilyticus]MBS7668976.1 tautomerase family protein [Croceicoccus gelatinilyticus]
MPVVQFNLVKDRYPREAIHALLDDVSEFYAATLYPDAEKPPVERVRAFVNQVEPDLWATGGRLVSEGGQDSPYFVCLVMTGRTIEQHHALIEGFTARIVRHLGCPQDVVRGQVVPIEPDNWGIAGVPASVVRRAEIEARAKG